MNMNKVELYTSDTCPNCVKVKEFLKLNGVEYIEYNISKRIEYKRKLISEGFLSVPVMKIGEEYILGFDIPRIQQLLCL